MNILKQNLSGATMRALFCAMALGCLTARAADAPAAVPPPAATNAITVPSGLTVDDVKASILEALVMRKLTVVDQVDGKITAYYASRNVTLTLAISYQMDQVTIEVKQWDSRPKALKSQERWLANVRKEIMDALVRRKAYK